MAVAIVVRLQFEGVHWWPGAPQDVPEKYLVHPHRHMFYVEASKTVEHMDRQIEIIALRRRIEEYCYEHFRGPHILSCEMMAQKLLAHFLLSTCQVLEDNENGAVVIR